ncbi:hypothetical protein [Endozoicomonas numazuensis]|uniref:Uncharacterized protein n=1 Tax=Endozoicomonas numazuensis TaxID=1137799 RepID=A0A081NJ98_9GAMM|nr:hypothetical protein [Endozoicomonas numazuensis]KEQ18521.1 hypothetical protein GZ78_13660 [Endozoicomonas numazuensis]
MSITLLNLRHRQKLGTALIALLMFMLLQVCLMEQTQAMDSAQLHMQKVSLDTSEMSGDMGMNHECCTPSPVEHLQKADQSCPDCDTDDHYIQYSQSDSKPAFTLLYIISELISLDSEPSRNWVSEPPPSIHHSQPDIYLANVSFLE